jgi:hypothetical protein
MWETILTYLTRIDWTDPNVHRGLVGLYRQLTGTDEATLQRKSTEERIRRLEEMQLKLSEILAGNGLPSGQVQTATVTATEVFDPDTIVDRLTVVSGDIAEALRFARTDGIDHPEAVRRMVHAQEVLDTLERYDLRPSVLSSADPKVRSVLEGQVLPAVRAGRQALHNSGSGGPPTVESLGDASAKIQRAAVQMRVLGATGGANPNIPVPPPPSSSVPSQYAPEMAVDTGCLPCGRAHIGAVAGTLETGARLASERGWDHPDTQAAIQTAAEELDMIALYDWTPDRIARTPEEDRRILEAFAPRVQELRSRISDVHDPQSLRDLASQAKDLHRAFVEQDMARASGRSAAMITRTLPTVADDSHRIRPPAWWYTPPTEVTIGQTTVPTDTARAFDNLTRALNQRGVRVRVRNLPTSPELGVLEGSYLFDSNAIVLGPAALAKDAYAVQILAHEAAHALADNPACHVYNASVPYGERVEEQMAQYASLIALNETGLPIELADLTEVPPGSRQIDWDLLRAELSPQDYSRLLWTSAWIADALQGIPRDYAAEMCPPTTLTALPRSG